MELAKEKKKEYIERLIDSYKKLDTAFEGIFKIFGDGVIESILWENVYKSFDSHINLVKEVVGDDYDWIEWYIYDNDCGEKKLEAGYSPNLKPIQSLDDLLDLIGDGSKSDPEDIRTNI